MTNKNGKKKGKKDTGHTEEGHIKTGAGIGTMCLHVKECQGCRRPPEARAGAGDRVSPTPPRPAETLISDFYCLQNYEGGTWCEVKHHLWSFGKATAGSEYNPTQI